MGTLSKEKASSHLRSHIVVSSTLCSNLIQKQDGFSFRYNVSLRGIFSSLRISKMCMRFLIAIPINHNSKLGQKHTVPCPLSYVLPSNVCQSAGVVTYRHTYVQAVHVPVFSRWLCRSNPRSTVPKYFAVGKYIGAKNNKQEQNFRASCFISLIVSSVWNNNLRSRTLAVLNGGGKPSEVL